MIKSAGPRMNRKMDVLAKKGSEFSRAMSRHISPVSPRSGSIRQQEARVSDGSAYTHSLQQLIMCTDKLTAVLRVLEVNAEQQQSLAVLCGCSLDDRCNHDIEDGLGVSLQEREKRLGQITFFVVGVE